MPGSSNFLQFNPSATNQENDSQYAADSLRSAGITNGAIVPSNLLNKALFQSSTMAAALAQAMAAKGYSISDANLNSLATTLANLLTLADFAAVISGTGYQKLPSGLIIQWGAGTVAPTGTGESSSHTSITFPISFPNGALSVTASANGPSHSGGWWPAATCYTVTNSGFILYLDNCSGGAQIFTNGVTASWIAIGY